jgi:hypothetical protein
MPRKSGDTNPTYAGGRPPKDPMAKVGIPVRCLVTPLVLEALQVSEQAHGISSPGPSRGRLSSDILRLAIYGLLEKEGLLDQYQLREDPTWETLQQAGIL